jgi:hypothetical protein
MKSTREEAVVEAIQPFLDVFDENVNEIAELPLEQQIPAIWATVRALYERMLRGEQVRSFGLF